MPFHFTNCLIKRIILKCLTLALPVLLTAQGNKAKFTVGEVPEDSLSFTQSWAYNWFIRKDDNGLFFSDGDAIKAEDTVHRFFTARCQTDVQGGYDLRYCYASVKKGVVKLNFSDGGAAYSSRYFVFIKGDSFYCKADLLYPMEEMGEKLWCVTRRQKLLLQKSKYAAGDTVKGYVSFSFTEILRRPNGQIYKANHHFEGCFCVLLGTKEETGW